MNVKRAYIWYMMLCCFNSVIYCASDQDGILVRTAVSADTLLTQKGAGTCSEMQRLISLYGAYASQKDADILKSIMQKDSTFYTHLLRDASYLLEGFFAHCGMLLGMTLFAGIDTTSTQIIDPKIFFQLGVVKPQLLETIQAAIAAPAPDKDAPPPLNSSASSSPATFTVAQACGSFFQASRYMRIMAESFNPGAPVPANPADLCAGIIIINNGWVCSLTMPSANSSLVQQKGSLFCLPAAISGQDASGNILGFVKNHSIDFIPFAEGIDQWTPYNNTRTMKLVVADDVGSTAFVSSQLGNGANSITLQIAKDGTVNLNDARGNILSSVTLNDAVKKFYSTLGSPWGVIIEMNNRNFNEGDLFPTLEIKGLVKLNNMDFPLQFQAPQSQKIGFPFSVQSMISAPQQLLQEVQLLSRYTQATIENNFTYGSCKDYTMTVSLPTFKKNNLYVDPLNTAYAKINGALEYDWETKKYPLQDALTGINKLLSGLFFRRHNMTPSYMMHNLKKDSNVLLI